MGCASLRAFKLMLAGSWLLAGGWGSSTLCADAGVVPAPAPAGAATTYQQNPLHDGKNVGEHLFFPLHEAWRHDFGDKVGYPLVVNGRVFVTVAGTGSSSNGARLYALDGATGVILWGPRQIGGIFQVTGTSADGTNVYTVNFNGVVEAFDQVLGALLWSVQMPFQNSFTSPPTVANGTLYIGGAGALYALNPADGAIEWTAPVENGDHSSPAVTSDGVYVSYTCEQTYKFAPATGALLWHHSTNCAGGGGSTPVVHGHSIYVRDDFTSPVILSTTDGQMHGLFQSDTAPAFSNRLGFYVQGGTLSAVDNPTQDYQWSSSQQLVTAPIVVGGAVIAGSSSGMIYAYDETTGSLLWSADCGQPILEPDEFNAFLLTGLAESGATLYVPATNVLIAYGSPCVCPVTDQCHTGTCDVATGACTIIAEPDGTACGDGDPCTQVESCQAGSCVGSSPLTCTAIDQCHTAGTCNPATGTCSNPVATTGTPCDDHNACTTTDSCVGGSCIGSGSLACGNGDACTISSCLPAVGCMATTADLDTTDFSAGRVDGSDLVVLANAWNSCPGDPRYNASANLAPTTACVDDADFHAFMTAFGYDCGG